MSDIVAADHLKSIVQRVERVEAEIADLNADKSEIYKEARTNGFDVKALKKVVSKRKLDESKREEEDAVFDTYWDAVHGSGLVHAHARENIEQFGAEAGGTSYAEAKGRKVADVHPDLSRHVVDGLQGKSTVSPSDGAPPAVSNPMATLGSEESVAPNSEPSVAGGNHEVAAQEVTAGQQSLVSIAAARKPLRPLCLRPEACGGYGDKTCHSCLVAARTTGEAA